MPFKTAALQDPQTPLLKALDAVIRKATDENQQQRYQSVAELRREIQNSLDAQSKASAIADIPDKTPSHTRWIWSGMALCVFLVGAMTLYHLLGGLGEKTEVFVSPAIESAKQPEAVSEPAELLPTRVSPDGRTMTLIRSDDASDKFYSDPSLVTFHHYVEFLNEVADDLTVEQDLVKRNDMILIYIGDGTAPEDQIIHQNGRFRLRNAEWAARPVVRVTWLGAQAYAHYYGKRLPAFDEWKLLRLQLAENRKPTDAPSQSPAGEGIDAHMEMMKELRGDAGGMNFEDHPVNKEWLNIRTDTGASSRVGTWTDGGDAQVPVLRYPWEGFSDVGFRTVMDVSGPSTADRSTSQ